MEFIETSSFSRYVYQYLSEEEYFGLQMYLAYQPEAGVIVVGSGGVRKIRWASKRSGKGGGVRVIYYFKKRNNEIWMLTIYSKHEVANIPAHILKKIAEEVEND